MGSGPVSQGAAGTATAPPVAGRVVLLEAPEGAAAEFWGILGDGGAQVSWCPGPEGPSPAWCPLMAGRRCSLVESADVVIFALGLETAPCRQVLAELERLHPETAVIVQASAPDAARWSPVLDGHTVLPAPLSRDTLLHEVAAAAAAFCSRSAASHEV